MIQGDDILKVAEAVMSLLQKELRDELKAQGHRLTGTLEQSIVYEVEKTPVGIVGTMYSEDYGLTVNFGVPASRIPYTSGGKRGGTSLYIQGLIEFWEKRGLADREAVGAAFATAAVHAREGMPTRASYRYSSTGDRTGFITAVVNRNMSRIEELIDEKFGAKLELRLAGEFNRTIIV
jgi:hypothetical protein